MAVIHTGDILVAAQPIISWYVIVANKSVYEGFHNVEELPAYKNYQLADPKAPVPPSSRVSLLGPTEGILRYLLDGLPAKKGVHNAQKEGKKKVKVIDSDNLKVEKVVRWAEFLQIGTLCPAYGIIKGKWSEAEEIEESVDSGH